MPQTPEVIPRPIDPFVRPVHAFFRNKLAGAGLLLLAAAVAIVWAASPFGHVHHGILETRAGLHLGPWHLEKTLHHWINDGLMSVFFFVVGLELKREMLEGELSSLRRASLPAVCALGGMLVPAAIYAVVNAGQPGLRGWGIPMATDIAFVLGVLAILGDRVPSSLKVLVTAVAVADDIGAIVVIALFYTQGLSIAALAGGACFALLAVGMNLAGVRNPVAYLIVGAAVWLCFLSSGVHATLAAVVVAFTIPARTRLDSRGMAQSLDRLVQHYAAQPLPEGHGLLKPYEQEVLYEIEDVVEKGTAPLQRIEHALLPFVTFVVLPLFAFANAGVTIEGDASALFGDRVFWGVLMGLVIGKPVGITLVAAIMVKLRVADLPEGVKLGDVAGIGILAGIGFTMSLFIGELAFVAGPTVEAAKVGTLAASTIAGALGLLFLARRFRARA